MTTSTTSAPTSEAGGATGTTETPAAPEAPKASAAPVPAAPKEPVKAKETPKAPEEDPLEKLLSNPLLQAEIQKRVQKAAAEAALAEKNRVEEEARRSKMEETERLRLEKTESENLANTLKEEQAKAIRRANLFKTVLDHGVKLQEGGSDFLEYQVEAAMKSDPTLSIEDAFKRTVSKHSFIVEVPAPPVVEKVEEKPATTAPSTKKAEVPASNKSEPQLDTLNMTRAEYEKYKREKHGYV